MLMLVQIDDRLGEVLGAELDENMTMIAHGVQLLSSHAKKGPPGCMPLIDLADELERPVAAYLGTGLDSWGCHTPYSTYRHFDISRKERIVVVGAPAASARSPSPVSSCGRARPVARQDRTPRRGGDRALRPRGRSANLERVDPRDRPGCSSAASRAELDRPELVAEARAGAARRPPPERGDT